ncbi:DUF4254 domain-containing protein [Nocardia brasiliensis]|uniref:DUF4254 domain-containing protein n=1 Tax=Nocardia brasiliensis TaxID=37326 RepID=UPI002454115D|nr:DUF4254 domain-containing protein [Nocardia brasiliensis]
MTPATAGYDADLDGLPTWHELMDAFGGWAGSSGHPVARCACGLARLHRKRCTGHRRSTVDERRAALITAIDAWASTHVRRTAQAEESLGAYVDRMAAASAMAVTVLRTCAPGGEAVHGAWCRLAALADGWTDITIAVVAPYRQTSQDRT